MANAADACLEKILELAEVMLALADAGDAAREDVGCGVLYGVLRDSAYKLQRLAAAEREVHRRKDPAKMRTGSWKAGADGKIN